MKGSEVCINMKLTPASLSLKGLLSTDTNRTPYMNMITAHLAIGCLPLMMHVPHRMIAIALHVMLGTVIRTTSWFVVVDHTRISLLPQVRNRSEHSLKSDNKSGKC